jgi:hypothetical protein
MEIYPEKKGKVRTHSKEERTLGAPLYDLDMLAIPYETIADVRVTTFTPETKKFGFMP